MNTRSVLHVLTEGGRAALICSGLGILLILSYSFLTSAEVIYLPLAIGAVGVISTFWGGLKGGMTSPTLGWLNGSLVGGLYLVSLLLLREVLPVLSLSPVGVIFGLVMLLSGAMGGVAGVNIRFVNRRKGMRRYSGS